MRRFLNNSRESREKVLAAGPLDHGFSAHETLGAHEARPLKDHQGDGSKLRRLMAIVVTGAAGFIGSQLVAGLNKLGRSDVIAVDNLTKADKFRNLVPLQISDYIDKGEFLDLLISGGLPEVEVIFHQGACSDTMEHDGRYMMANNYRFSLALLEWCQAHRVPFLYASSAATYGPGKAGFREEPACEGPLNVYGYSKLLMDQVVRPKLAAAESQIVGFRYFNVYGPGEAHKGRMASVAFHNFNQFSAEGKVSLFEGCDGYEHGGQLRDFVYVEDVVEANLWFWQNKGPSGIYNCGTGRAQPFNDIATTTVNTLRSLKGEVKLSREEMVDQGLLNYIPFPDALRGKYQSFTQADLSNLRASGCPVRFRPVEEGVDAYVRFLSA